LNKTISKAALIAVLGCAASVSAQPTSNEGHLYDTRGNVVMSGSGLCWKTTRWTPAMAIAECDPDLLKKAAPAAPLAAPMPKPAPAPAPAAKSKACDFTATLASDETFGFNKATLTAQAKAKLDKDVVAKLGSCGKVSLILVTGHTDRLGSSQYNQKLSEKRAEAVKAYLVGKGANASVMETMGAGKTQPAQGVPKCSDKLSRKKLIECLAPNRRVSIEVKGLAK